MVSFEIFVKSMMPSLLELKVTPSFCFAFKIPDDVTATIIHVDYVSLHVHIRVVAFFTSMLPVKAPPKIAANNVMTKTPS